MPGVLDVGLLDEVMPISSHDSVDHARRLATEEGLMCGISSGAAVAAALRWIPACLLQCTLPGAHACQTGVVTRPASISCCSIQLHLSHKRLFVARPHACWSPGLSAKAGCSARLQGLLVGCFWPLSPTCCGLWCNCQQGAAGEGMLRAQVSRAAGERRQVDRHGAAQRGGALPQHCAVQPRIQPGC